MSDMLWLQHFVDERIAAAHKETAAAPNTAHGSVVVDRFGHVVSGMPGASSGSSGILLVSASTGSTVTYANTDDTLINFSEDYDPSNLYSSGVFTAAEQARYMVQCHSCYVNPFGSGYSANTGCLLWVYRNTTDSMGPIDDGTVGAAVSSTGWFMLLHGDFQLALNVGETVEVHFQNNSGASRKLNLGAILNIYKVT